jgi:hypothetical protein
MLDCVRPLIVNLRQGIDPDQNWRALRLIVETQTDQLCRELNTRWLVSVCDTYVDFASDIERRNAMLISMLVSLEKVAQSYLMWRVNYTDAFNVPASHEPRKIRLWDGMTSMHVEIGDVTNNLFRRLNEILSATPHLHKIYEVVMKRIAENDTVLGTMNRRHRHVFETDLKWLDAPEYDKWREAGQLPAKLSRD